MKFPSSDSSFGLKQRDTRRSRFIDLPTDHLLFLFPISTSREITVVPILIGAISTTKEVKFGEILAPYLKDESHLFVVSSDFCHW